MKYKINQLLLSDLNFSILRPYSEEEIIVNLNFQSTIEINELERDILIFSFPKLEIDIYESIEDEYEDKNGDEEEEIEDKDEYQLAKAELSYFVVIDIYENSEKLDTEKIKEKFRDIIKDEITPYMNSELNNLLLKAGFPPIYSFKKHYLL